MSKIYPKFLKIKRLLGGNRIKSKHYFCNILINQRVILFINAYLRDAFLYAFYFTECLLYWQTGTKTNLRETQLG